MAWFADHEPQTLAQARKDAAKRGPSWRKALAGGLQRLEREYPEIAGRMG